ncbi:MAG: type II toxin-antitoxin system prevent-host-death family antitoxin [Burkholderiaceae bacterium]|nr:MAG: type II toxin-antitoxin system prevent-host-death family antitoxin [Burkholderiaceae bacterium]MCC7286174.1 type II toxin-antitoxin system prevent-host-death family antitoxin [Burkholderiaceae bacterium]
MIVTATDAKNRLGQMLEHCQREPVVIEKSGRRHSVLLSAQHYDALVARGKSRRERSKSAAQAFYERYKGWVDEQNRRFEERGLWNDELRTW